MTGCRSYDGKLDIAYSLKTEPEKTILDFFHSLNNKDPDFIYTNLLPDSDKNNISREKYVSEFKKILSDIESIDVKETVYLGFENNMSKVVAEFEVSYKNGEVKQYKKYIDLHPMIDFNVLKGNLIRFEFMYFGRGWLIENNPEYF